ncbi:putative membrane protein [Actinomycetales bacterium JB111]|nr:putative membrane protein [Actinomycetales bacterium JB111]
MIAGILVLMVGSVLQLALVLHVRNTLVDAASEGARYAALQGSSLAAGTDRTEQLISTSLSSSFAEDVSADVLATGGVPLVEVTVRAPMPTLGMWSLVGSIEVTGHAALEELP